MTWEIIRIAIFSPLWAWVGGFGILGIALLALWWFTPSFLASPEKRIILLCAGIACFALGGFYTKAFKDGERHMTQRLAAQDQAAWRRVERGGVEVDACNGGVDWDTETGNCRPGSGVGSK
jgi:hypothetical protein